MVRGVYICVYVYIDNWDVCIGLLVSFVIWYVNNYISDNDNKKSIRYLSS